jgi:hypothetical protein
MSQVVSLIGSPQRDDAASNQQLADFPLGLKMKHP